MFVCLFVEKKTKTNNQSEISRVAAVKIQGVIYLILLLTLRGGEGEGAGKVGKR